MQLSPKIKNKSLIWSLLLKVRVGTVVNAGGNYYFNTSGKNSAVTDSNNWFQIFSNAGGATTNEVNKTAADISGTSPDFSLSLAADGVPVFPVILKIYVDIAGDNNYKPIDPVIYNPGTKVLSGLSSPVDFPLQKLKIFFQ